MYAVCLVNHMGKAYCRCMPQTKQWYVMSSGSRLQVCPVLLALLPVMLHSDFCIMEKTMITAALQQPTIEVNLHSGPCFFCLW